MSMKYWIYIPDDIPYIWFNAYLEYPFENVHERQIPYGGGVYVKINFQKTLTSSWKWYLILSKSIIYVTKTVIRLAKLFI